MIIFLNKIIATSASIYLNWCTWAVLPLNFFPTPFWKVSIQFCSLFEFIFNENTFARFNFCIFTILDLFTFEQNLQMVSVFFLISSEYRVWHMAPKTLQLSPLATSSKSYHIRWAYNVTTQFLDHNKGFSQVPGNHQPEWREIFTVTPEAAWLKCLSGYESLLRPSGLFKGV